MANGVRGTRDSLDEMSSELESRAMSRLQQRNPGLEFEPVPPRPPEAAPTGRNLDALNMFDEPDAEQEDTRDLSALKLFDDMDIQKTPEPKPLPVPPAETQGWMSSMMRGLGERTANIVGFVPDTANTIADLMPQWLDAGLVIDEKGVRFETGEAYADKSFARRASEGADNIDLGSKDGTLTTTEDIKSAWNSGDKGAAAKGALWFAVEQGVLSLPDMVAVVANMPAYMIGLGGNYAQERAANDGRERADGSDALMGAATAATVGILEKYGADRVLDRLGGKDKTKTRKWLEGIFAEAATEAVQNPAEFIGTRYATAKEGEITSQALIEQGGFGALGGAGGGAIIGGAVQLASPSQRPPQAPEAPQAAPTPPSGATAPTVSPGPQPAAQPQETAPQPPAAPTASAPPGGGIRPGVLTTITPDGGTPTAVRVVTTSGDTAQVTPLDDAGEPRIDPRTGKEAVYTVPMSAFPMAGGAVSPQPVPSASPAVAPPAAPPAAPAATPAAAAGPAPVAAPPAAPIVDAPTAEPIADLVAQVKDMWRGKGQRRGVYLSADNVAAAKQKGAYDSLVKSGVVVENFDKKGGVIVTKSKKTAKEAEAARDGGGDMQTILGILTGSGTWKAPNADTVVEQKTPAGEVVQGTVVAQAAAAEAAAQMEANAAARAEAETPKKVRSALAQLTQLEPMINDSLTVEGTSSKGKAYKKLGPKKADALATLSAAGNALSEAIREARTRGAPDEVVERARAAAKAVSKHGELDEAGIEKGWGISDKALREQGAAIIASAKELAQYADKPKTEEAPAAEKPKGKLTIKKAKPAAAAAKPADPKKERKKYVPPKKREQTAEGESAAAAESVAAQVESTKAAELDMPSVNLTGKEPGFIAQILGVRESAIAEDLQSDQGPSFERFVESVLGDMKAGKWPGKVAGLYSVLGERGDQLTRLMRDFAYTETAAEQAVVREQLLGFLTNIDGKAAPQSVVAAVFDAANAVRAYTRIRNLVSEDTYDTALDERDVGETVNVTTKRGAGFSSRRRKDVGETIAGVLRSYEPVVAHLRSKLTLNLMKQMQDTGRSLDSRQLLMDMIAAPGVEPHVKLLMEKLLMHAPSVPVKFVSKTPSGELGYYSPRTKEIVMLMTNKDRQKFVATLLHEIVHAATLNELDYNGSGKFAQAVEAIRKQAIVAAAKKFGVQKVANTIAHFENLAAGLENPPNMDVIREGYGLTNSAEFVSEVLTNPAFQQFLADLDGGTPVRVLNSFLNNKVVRAIADWLGLKDPRASRLLKDGISAALELIDAQVAAKETLEQAVDELLAVKPFYSRKDARQLLYSTDARFRVAEPFFAREDRKVVSDNLFVARAMNRNQVPERRASFASPPPLKNGFRIRNMTSGFVTRTIQGMRDFGKTELADQLRSGAKAVQTLDNLLRRGSRLFDSSDNDGNPLVQWKKINERRRSFANQILERAERDVNAAWVKLSVAESEQLGELLQQSTLWQIDPTLDDKQPQLLVKGQRFTAAYEKLVKQWASMSPAQKALYRQTQDYFKWEFSKVRRAAIDLAVDLYANNQLTPQQKTLLYAIRTPEEVSQVVGNEPGKAVNLGDPRATDQFATALRDFVKTTSIRGPYFPLRRYGSKVVTAEKEGSREFANEEAATAWADELKTMAPKNRAKVSEQGGKYVVDYKMYHVSFHESVGEAEAEQVSLRQRGYSAPLITEKLQQVQRVSLTDAQRQLLDVARKRLGVGTDMGLFDSSGNPISPEAAMVASLEAAFTQILAERAAIGSQMKREGWAGFKAREANRAFAERATSSAWHFANLKTTFESSKALSRLRLFTTDPTIGNNHGSTSSQETMLERGRFLGELERRIQLDTNEAETAGAQSKIGALVANLGFVNFLATPSYVFVNATQNFNVTMPVMMGKYGIAGVKAMVRGMRVVASPAFAESFRALAKTPGSVTTYDIAQAIVKAAKKDPRMARWVEPGRDGSPSALQQLIDRGVVNASFVQEILAVANNQSRPVRMTMDWLRLMPQGAELFNRVSTALAVLDVTGGNVDAAADIVDQTHFNYALENRPRAFKQIGSVKLPQAITMFKMYSVGMYQLLVNMAVDASSKSGSKESRAAARAAMAGVIATHTLSAGVLGGLLIEPLRFLIWAAASAFGDDDEPFDLDTEMQRWIASITDDPTMRNIIARGGYNALGIDLSSRVGLNHILFMNPPDFSQADAAWKSIGELLGPVPSMVVRRSQMVYEKWTAGDPFGALMSAIPVKMLDDAQAAWKLYDKGVTAKSGAPLVNKDEFNGLDVLTRAMGFRSSEEARQGAQSSTAFNYREWRKQRVGVLVGAWSDAMRSGDQKEQLKAIEAIRGFNSKNPTAPITSDSLSRAWGQQVRQTLQAEGLATNAQVRELLAY